MNLLRERSARPSNLSAEVDRRSKELVGGRPDSEDNDRDQRNDPDPAQDDAGDGHSFALLSSLSDLSQCDVAKHERENRTDPVDPHDAQNHRRNGHTVRRIYGSHDDAARLKRIDTARHAEFSDVSVVVTTCTKHATPRSCER